MIPALPRPRRLLVLGAACLVGVACVVSTTTRRHLVGTSELTGTRVTSPVRAHLLDGGLVVFADGLTIDGVRASGPMRRFNALREEVAATAGVPLDSVLGFEVYRRDVNPFRTLVYGTTTLAASAIGTVALAVALFGSCPTVYADSAGVPTLQAESFSYSIAPLLAKRDVDRMTVVPDAGGRIRLAVRNEALETHHLDHMELVELRHAPHELGLPSPRGGALAASELAPRAAVTDGAGRNVGQAVAAIDTVAFSTDRALLDRAVGGGPTDDRLVISVPYRPGRDSVALVLRARAACSRRRSSTSTSWAVRGRSRSTGWARTSGASRRSPLSARGTAGTSACASRCRTGRRGGRSSGSWTSGRPRGARWASRCRRYAGPTTACASGSPSPPTRSGSTTSPSRTPCAASSSAASPSPAPSTRTAARAPTS
jgi:hypothetical protein